LQRGQLEHLSAVNADQKPSPKATELANSVEEHDAIALRY
jgi:hypothetical protein